MSTSTASRRSCHSIPPGQTSCFANFAASVREQSNAA
jgi:hypothetical protein